MEMDILRPQYFHKVRNANAAEIRLRFPGPRFLTAERAFDSVQKNPVRRDGMLVSQGMHLKEILVQMLAKDLHVLFRAAQTELIGMVHHDDFLHNLHRSLIP